MYRLILRKTPPTRRNSVWDLKITPTYTKSLLTSYIVDDNQVRMRTRAVLYLPCTSCLECIPLG